MLRRQPAACVLPHLCDDYGDAKSIRTMKSLWIVFLVLATVGSVYPFDFQLSGLDGTTLEALLRTCCGVPGRGDLLGNVMLFLPVGFVGILALGYELPLLRAFVIVCVVGGVTALLLQVAQIFLPSRDENLQDVAWNVLGVVIGSVLALRAGNFSRLSGRHLEQLSLVPLTLICAWLVYKLMPFVPSIDLQSIKDSLKPLLYKPLSITDVVHDVVAWLCVAYLLQNVRTDKRLHGFLPALIAGVLLLEVLIVDNVVDKSNVVGALVAVLAWWVLQQSTRRPEGALLLFLFGMLALTGIAPFNPRLEPVAFGWLPFQGFLEGSMYVNAQSAAAKVFLYGSLVYLLWRARVSIVSGIVIAFSFVLGIEFAQIYLVGRTPELTDPLLVIFAALALVVVERHQGTAVTAKSGAGASRESATFKANSQRRVLMKIRKHWVCQTINLQEHHAAFLAKLATELGVSVSGATRRIIEQFINGLELDAELESKKGSNESSHTVTSERWVPISVNLRRRHFDFLEQLGRELGMSVSGTVRLIIAHFVSRLHSESYPAN